jgi:hypothetical protein
MICSYIQEHIKDKLRTKLAEHSKPESERKLTKPLLSTHFFEDIVEEEEEEEEEKTRI